MCTDRVKILQNTTLLFNVFFKQTVHLLASLQKPFFTPQIPRKCFCLHCESGKSGLENITLHCALPALREEGWAIRLGWVGRKSIHAFVPYRIFEEVGVIVRTEIIVKNGNKNKLDRIKWHKRTYVWIEGRGENFPPHVEGRRERDKSQTVLAADYAFFVNFN